jgi:glycerophosphoryl diester phosphodiesterase
MNLAATAQHLAMRSVDGIYACIPRRTPSPQALAACKVISHRGEHDNRSIFENSLPAFAAAREAGVWGLEADIRWTRDLVPVICHDPDGRRLFGESAAVRELSFSALRARMPLIPSLAELVAECGSRMHLMLEIKDEPWPQLRQQQLILEQLLASLRPAQDYHFLALDPQLFQRVPFVPRAACLPVAELNTRRTSQAGLESGLGGLTGHFVLLNQRLAQRHWVAGQGVGTGFISSRNSLYRELNRGVEWIFSNHALRIQGILDRALAA